MAVKKQFKSFEDMIANSDTPLLVDFYADWCGPCRMLAPILEQVQSMMKHQVQVVKIDTERYPDLASTYHIGALPTLVLFKQGKPVKRIEGVKAAEAIVADLQSVL